MLIHFLHVAYGCFHATTAELGGYVRQCGPQSLKYYLALCRRSLQTSVKNSINLEICKHLKKKNELQYQSILEVHYFNSAWNKNYVSYKWKFVG